MPADPLPPVALLPCGVMVLTADNLIESLNPYACELLGYEAGELIGKRVDVVLNVPSRIYFQTHLYPLIALRNAASEIYLTVRTRQRVPIPILANAVQWWPDGQARTLFSFIPVTQRRQYEQDLVTAKRTAENELLRNEKLLQVQRELEQNQTELDHRLTQLRQRNEELEQFSKIISHDLQEPLRKIMVFADLLHKEGPGSQTPTGHTALTGIGKASARLQQLVKDLQLYFSQSRQLLLTAPVDLTALIERITRTYDPAEVTFQVQPLPTVTGSEAELHSLFRGLIDNAMKFRREGQKTLIHIVGAVVSHNSFRTTPDKYRYVDYARISVADNGIGFDNRYQEEIFQVMKKLNPHTPGIGLGLAMAKKVVERHNGHITAESVPGAGTTITLLLPVG